MKDAVPGCLVVGQTGIKSCRFQTFSWHTMTVSRFIVTARIYSSLYRYV